MPLTLTKEEFSAKVRDLVKEMLGEQLPDLAKASQERVDKFLKDVETRIEQRMNTLPSGGPNTGGFSLQNRSHPYIEKYGNRLRNDPIQLPGANNKIQAKGAGIRYARLIRHGIQARRLGISLDKVIEAQGDTWMLDDLKAHAERVAGTVRKAQGADIFETGGALVPEDYSTEFIELLRPMVVVRSAGAIQVPLPNGNMTFRRRVTSSALQYAAEGATVPSSQGTYGQIRLNAMVLRGSVPIANELLEMQDADADIIVRNDLLMSLSERSDASFLRGNGASNTPTGMRFLANTSQFAATAGTSTDNRVSDLVGAMTRLATANVPMMNLAWFLNPRTRIALQFTRDVGGGFLFGPEMAGGTLMGVPFFETTQIPANLGGGAEAEIMLASMSNVWIGDQTMARIEVFPGGAYNDGSVVQSGIANNETVISISASHDIDITHDVVVAGVTGVAY